MGWEYCPRCPPEQWPGRSLRGPRQRPPVARKPSTWATT